MLADLESSKSTELPEGASPDSFSAEADSDAAGATATALDATASPDPPAQDQAEDDAAEFGHRMPDALTSPAASPRDLLLRDKAVATASEEVNLENISTAERIALGIGIVKL